MLLKCFLYDCLSCLLLQQTPCTHDTLATHTHTWVEGHGVLRVACCLHNSIQLCRPPPSILPVLGIGAAGRLRGQELARQALKAVVLQPLAHDDLLIVGRAASRGAHE